MVMVTLMMMMMMIGFYFKIATKNEIKSFCVMHGIDRDVNSEHLWWLTKWKTLTSIWLQKWVQYYFVVFFGYGRRFRRSLIWQSFKSEKSKDHHFHIFPNTYLPMSNKSIITHSMTQNRNENKANQGRKLVEKKMGTNKKVNETFFFS